MKTPLVIFILALAAVLFACASPAAAGDDIINPGETRYVASGQILTINSGDTLTISPGGHLIANNSGNIYNYGTINNCGTINSYGTINNLGTINNYGNIYNLGSGTDFITNDGTINNCGTINNSYAFQNCNTGTINNCGTINNGHPLLNDAIINNYESGIINGDVVGGSTVIDRSDEPCPFYCPCEEVAALTPIGLIALVSLLGTIAALNVRRKRQ